MMSFKGRIKIYEKTQTRNNKTYTFRQIVISVPAKYLELLQQYDGEVVEFTINCRQAEYAMLLRDAIEVIDTLIQWIPTSTIQQRIHSFRNILEKINKIKKALI